MKYRYCTTDDLQNMQFNGYFLKDNNSDCGDKCLSWATGDCFVPRIRGRWKECIEKQNSITFIGDSQMR